MATTPALRKAVQRLNISDVVVKSITATLADEVIPGVTIDMNEPTVTQSKVPACVNFMSFDAQEDSNKSSAERLLVFEMTAGVRILRGTSSNLVSLQPDEIEAAVIATIEATFYVSYTETAQEGQFCDDECLTDFAAENVPFNAWPYWREVVQSACSRLALPRVILPTKRITRGTSVQISAPKEAPPAAARGRNS